MWPNRDRIFAADFAPTPRARESRRPCRRRHPGSRGSTRGYAELLDHPGTVVDHLAAPVELHHPAVGGDALGEVLVGRADDHLLDPGIGRRHRRPGGEAVVGLVHHLRPHREARQIEQLLDLRELSEQVGFDTAAVLVAGVEIVAERLDDLIGGDPDVGGTIGHEVENGVEHATLRPETRILVGRRSGSGTARRCRRRGGPTSGEPRTVAGPTGMMPAHGLAPHRPARGGHRRPTA
ncbi:MAG: hypothetical protein R2695_05815 [Acidimicrobiales bacterium]